MEEQFVAAVGVLLPSRKLVIHGQGHALFEAFASPRRETDDVPIALQTKRHVKVFRHVALRPKLVIAVLILVRNLLNGRPAKNGVVADKGSNIAVGDGVRIAE